MTSLQKFFLRVIVFGIIVTVSVILLNRVFIRLSYPYEYLGGMLNDKHKIAEQTHSPKVLIIGGSGGSFGINSDTLEKYLGMPVVNMSLMAPLGTYFLMNDALKEIKKGDKVFISTEYDIEKYSTPDVIYPAVDYYPEGTQYIKKDTSILVETNHLVKHKLSNLRKLFWNTFSKNKAKDARIDDTSSVYFRNAFSAKGDIISHVNNPSNAINFTLFTKEKINYSAQIDDINNLIAQAKKIGAEVYFIFPPLARSTFMYSKVAVESVESQLKKELKCAILGSAQDFVQDDSSFFDSFYHLKPAARDINTFKIVLFYNLNKSNSTQPGH